jgi:ATP-binding cassette subfamily C protein LapB
LPVILLLDRQQACLLLARKPDGRLVILPCEPGAIEVEIAAEDLNLRYIGTCIFVRPTIQVEDRSIVEARPTEKDWFWGTIWRYKGVLPAGGRGGSAGERAGAGRHLLHHECLRPGHLQPGLHHPLDPGGGVLVAMIFEYLARNLRSWLLDNAGKKADLLLGSALFRQAMMSRLENRPQSAGAYASTLREFESVRDFATSATLATISDLPFILLFVWVIHMISGPCSGCRWRPCRC